MVDGRDQHSLQLSFILGSHHREVGHAAQVADVVLPLVGGAIGTDDAGAIHHESDGQILNADIVDELVVGPLQEGAVDGAYGLEPLASHACCHGHSVLFGDTDIEILVGKGLFQQVEPCSSRHGCSDSHHPGILLTDLDQGLAENLAIAGWFWFVGGVGLATGQVEGTLGVVTHLVGLGIGVPLALGGGHMDKNGALVIVGLLEDPDHAGDVVAIDGTHVGEAQLFKDGPELGDRQALHALLEVLELCRQLAVHERQMFNRFLGVVLEELQRFAVPHAVEMGRQGAHRRTDRHVVVVQHHKQPGLGQVPGVVDRLKGHAPREGTITDHGDALVIVSLVVACEGHAERRRNRRAGVAGTEMIKGAFAALQIAGNPTLLAEGMKIVVAACDQLVGVGLVAHVPHNLVTVEVEGLVEGQGKFHNPQARAKVPSGGADDLQMPFADLAGNGLEFGNAEAMQLIRMSQLAEMHHGRGSDVQSRPCRPWPGADCDTGRHERVSPGRPVASLP